MKNLTQKKRAIPNVEPCLSCKTSTAPNYKEWRQIANKTRENLNKILTPYDDKLTCGLLLQLFGEIKNALSGMHDPHEKKYIFDDCLSKIISDDFAYDLTDELVNHKCYRTLFYIVAEPSDDGCDENGIFTGYAHWTSREEEEAADE
jgi:hypothetical protein